MLVGCLAVKANNGAIKKAALLMSEKESGLLAPLYSPPREIIPFKEIYNIIILIIKTQLFMHNAYVYNLLSLNNEVLLYK